MPNNILRGCLHSLFLALRVKLSFEVTTYHGCPQLRREGFFLVWGCVKSLFLALRAKFKFETDVFFMILRSKIMKNTSVSKEYSAAEGRYPEN